MVEDKWGEHMVEDEWVKLRMSGVRMRDEDMVEGELGKDMVED